MGTAVLVPTREKRNKASEKRKKPSSPSCTEGPDVKKPKIELGAASAHLRFADLKVGREERNLLPPTLEYLDSQGFDRCSPVQEVCISAFLGNNDVAVEACTGSGKTLAFLIPSVEHIFLRLQGSGVNPIEVPLGGFDGLAIGVLVMAPTRELVNQIHGVLHPLLVLYQSCQASREFGQYMFALELYGGRPMKTDLLIVEGRRSKLPKLHEGNEARPLGILVTTPGRLKAHLEGTNHSEVLLDRHWTFKSVGMLILDEADRLFADKNFQEQMSVCLRKIPSQRRTGLFSATLTDEIRTMGLAGLRQPLFIKLKIDHQRDEEASLPEESTESAVKQHSVPSGLNNFYLQLETTCKLAYFLKVIKNRGGGKLMAFCSTCALVNYLHMVLDKILIENAKCKADPVFIDSDWTVSKLHGHMEKSKRAKAVKTFEASTKGILITSDLAARGLDFSDVDIVVQFDAPQTVAAFFHRIGRTARAGRSGTSLIFLDSTEARYVAFLASKGLPLQDFSTTEQFQAIAKTALPSSPASHWSVPIKGPTYGPSALSVQTICLVPEGVDIDSQLASESNALLILLKLANFTDRIYYEAAKEAFVASVKAYSEHQLPFVFVLRNLQLGLLANSLGLFRIPRVKEILGVKVDYFTPESVNPAEIKFVDPALQLKFEARQLELAEERENKKREHMKLMQDRKKKTATTRSMKKKQKKVSASDEWFSLQKEERLARRLSLGRISLKEFNQLTQAHESGESSGECSTAEDESNLIKSTERGKTLKTPRWVNKKRRKRKAAR